LLVVIYVGAFISCIVAASPPRDDNTSTFSQDAADSLSAAHEVAASASKITTDQIGCVGKSPSPPFEEWLRDEPQPERNLPPHPSISTRI
jgi:hypothetical protein